MNLKELANRQIFLRKKLKEISPNKNFRFIGGADVSTFKFKNVGYGAIVVMDIEEKMRIVDYCVIEDKIDFPYIPTLLAFREVPILKKAFKKLKIIPDVIIVDGQGKIHPRGFGLACHLGVELNISTIGCAKSLLCGEFKEPPLKKGSKSRVYFKNQVVGYALRTKDNIKPIFVSVGNLITIEESIDVIFRCLTKYRLPEPIRNAHALCSLKRRSSDISRFVNKLNLE